MDKIASSFFESVDLSSLIEIPIANNIGIGWDSFISLIFCLFSISAISVATIFGGSLLYVETVYGLTGVASFQEFY